MPPMFAFMPPIFAAPPTRLAFMPPRFDRAPDVAGDPDDDRASEFEACAPLKPGWPPARTGPFDAPRVMLAVRTFP